MQMPLRVVSLGSPKTNDLINWFHHYGTEMRSVDLLDETLKEILTYPLKVKELDIVLYHTSKAINHGVYGKRSGDQDKARRIVKSHIQTWSDKFISAYSNQGPTNNNTLDHDFCESLSGFRFLHLQPPARLFTFIQNKITENIANFSAFSFSYVLSDIGHLALPIEKSFINAISKHAKSLIPSFSPDEAIEVLYSLAVIDSIQRSNGYDGCATLKETFETLLNDNRIRAKLAQVQDQYNMQRRLLDAIYWFQRKDLVQEYPKVGDTASLFESDAKAAFEARGAISIPTKPHRITNKRIDLREKFANKVFYVQCDGPTHFLKRSDDDCIVLNGHTIFQTGLQLKREPDEVVLRLPHDLFYANRDNKEFFDAILVNATRAKPCGYVIGNAGALIPITGGYEIMQENLPDTCRHSLDNSKI